MFRFNILIFDLFGSWFLVVYRDDVANCVITKHNGHVYCHD